MKSKLFDWNWSLQSVEPSAKTNALVGLFTALIVGNYVLLTTLLTGPLAFSAFLFYLAVVVVVIVEGSTLKRKMEWSDRRVGLIKLTVGIVGFAFLVLPLLFMPR